MTRSTCLSLLLAILVIQLFTGGQIARAQSSEANATVVPLTDDERGSLSRREVPYTVGVEADAYGTASSESLNDKIGWWWNDLPVWRPYAESSFRGGGIHERGELDLFVPLLWTHNELAFADLRGSIGDTGNHEGNWALAYRILTHWDWILGGWCSYDLRQSQTGNHFDQVSFGLEAMDLEWEFRVAGYVPTNADPKLVPGTQVQAVFTGNNIVVRSNQESAYWGMDSEIGRLLWCNEPECRSGGDSLPRLGAEIRAFAGGYYFDNSAFGFEKIAGPRARLELRLYDLPLLGEGSRLTLEALAQYDGVRGAQVEGAAYVRIPFGPRTGVQLSPIQRRMVDRIVRDVDVVTDNQIVVEPAINLCNGETISGAVSVDGTTPDPEAAIEGAGTNSVAIVDGSNGVINLPGTINMPTGQVIMGGGSQLQLVAAHSGFTTTFTAPGTRGTLMANGFDAVNTSNNACIQIFDIVTTGNGARGMVINNDINVTIDDVAITTTGAGAHAIQSINVSQFTINDSILATSGAAASGIFSSANSQFLVDSSTITTSGDFAAGIASITNSLFTVSGSTIMTSGVGADGIASIINSQFTVNGSNITTSGDGADGIASIINSQFTVNNSEITTEGIAAEGIESIINSQFTVNNSEITTNGFAADGIASFTNSQFTVNSSDINTGGDQADGIQALNSSQFTLNGANIMTTGANAHGIFAQDNAQFTVNGGSITTTGMSARGVQASSSANNALSFAVNGVTIESADDGIFLDGASGAGIVNATITGSTITAGAGAGIHEFDAAADGTATICLNASGNTLNSGAGTINLNNIGDPTSTINVTQDAAASGVNGIDTLNDIPAGNVTTTNAINFNAGPCPTP